MKASLIGAYLLALGAGSALAADLPTVKAPPPVYPLPTPAWTGFYAGLNAGYDWGTSAKAVTDATPLFDAIAVDRERPRSRARRVGWSSERRHGASELRDCKAEPERISWRWPNRVQLPMGFKSRGGS